MTVDSLADLQSRRPCEAYASQHAGCGAAQPRRDPELDIHVPLGALSVIVALGGRR